LKERSEKTWRTKKKRILCRKGGDVVGGAPKGGARKLETLNGGRKQEATNRDPRKYRT